VPLIDVGALITLTPRKEVCISRKRAISAQEAERGMIPDLVGIDNYDFDVSIAEIPTAHKYIDQVMLVAADPTRDAAERAADLGHPIVVSYRSAAAVHGIGNMYADRPEMTAPVRKQSRRSDVIVHRADVPRSDITIARSMPVTTIERTLADLARTEPKPGPAGCTRGHQERRRYCPLAHEPGEGCAHS